MYKNVGKKIQTVAKVFAWIGIIIFLLIGAIVLYAGLNSSSANVSAYGILLLVIAPIVVWLSSLTMVGFGKLVQTSEETKAEVEKLAALIKKEQ